MKLLLMPKQAERIDESYQSEIMITMEMGNKNMGDLASSDLEIDHLDLCAFPAIHQVIIPIKRNHLAGGMAIECRNCRVISKDSYREHTGKILI